MEIVFLPSLGGSIYEKDVWEMLCEADAEFIPPLSQRESTTQSDLTDVVAAPLPVSYFEQLKGQSLLLAVEDDRAVGMMSYRQDDPEIENCRAYISTVIVRKACRGRKITEALYGELLRRERGWIATRTWSLNSAHIHILEKLGFALVKRLVDHRGPGIDTVYYGKENG